jgi:hypothetical protein
MENIKIKSASVNDGPDGSAAISVQWGLGDGCRFMTAYTQEEYDNGKVPLETVIKGAFDQFALFYNNHLDMMKAEGKLS